MSYALGKKPPIDKPALRLSAILSSDDVEMPIDRVEKGTRIDLPDWQMLGNDTYGDCVAVTWANYRRVMSRLVGHEVYPNQQQVFDLYRTQNPNFPRQDEGMVIQTVLEYLQKRGDIVAFAKVNQTDSQQVARAMDIFGGLWVGVDLTQEHMDDIDRGVSWNVSYEPSIGGHSILYGQWDLGVDGPEGCVTWGRVQESTDEFWRRHVDEAWVVVWPENLGTKQFEQGIDIQALQREFTALTGRDLVLPTPTSEPTGIDVDRLLWQGVQGWVRAKHYTKATRTLAFNLLTWAKAKGLA